MIFSVQTFVATGFTAGVGLCGAEFTIPPAKIAAARRIAFIAPPSEQEGKIAEPTEFGKLVTIQESEHQIITAYEVHDRRPADVTPWPPVLDRHIAMFDRPPDLAAAGRGFASAANEDAAITRGVRRIILPRPGRKTPARRAHERQRWFRRGQRWRVGCEGRISVLKRRHGLRRCRYRGADGTARWVGLGVIANNPATFLSARATT
ncbi:MAG TPA: transposase [Vicinamibacterales bacterium]|nr:transposase [Vicinamibacterales bacterium]